jgi:hypothetical protein
MGIRHSERDATKVGYADCNDGQALGGNPARQPQGATCSDGAIFMALFFLLS